MLFGQRFGGRRRSEPLLEGRLFQCGLPDLFATLRRAEPDLVVSLAWVPHRRRPMGPGDAEHVEFLIADGPLPDDMGRLREVVGRVVETVTSGGRAVVHCAAGANRSGLVCALAVRRVLGVDGETAVERVRSARPRALSNRTFREYVASLPPPE